MSSVRELVAAELTAPVDPRVRAIAAAIAGQHGDASRAVLFYGSCLRQEQLDGLMLDFYLIVADYRSAYDKRWLAVANRLIPPNVFYFDHGGLVAKYAVLSDADFAHECGPDAWTVSTAARFAQPSRLVWSASEEAASRAIDIVSTAAPTLLGWTRDAMGDDEVLDLWAAAFAMTFNAELRAEKLTRPAALVEADPQRYRAFGDAALAGWDSASREGRGRRSAERWWRRKQAKGKAYSVARLTKASATFAGGADYIVWKINRHAGTNIALKPWQRRHPLLAGLTLLPRLIRLKAIR